MNSRVLMGLPVQTVSGTLLGRVASIDIERETGHLANIHVRSTHLVSRLSGAELVISWGNIIEIREEMVIVSDALVEAASEGVGMAQAAQTQGSAVAGKSHGVYAGS